MLTVYVNGERAVEVESLDDENEPWPRYVRLAGSSIKVETRMITEVTHNGRRLGANQEGPST